MRLRLFATRRLLRAAVENREGNLRPVERGKPKARALAVRHRQAAERATVKGAFKRDDKAAIRFARSLHTIQEHRFDGVLHRLGTSVHDEVTRRSRWRDPVQRRLQLQRDDGLILRMCVARERVRQMVQHRVNDVGFVLSERLCGDERPHVEKAIRLTLRIAIDGGEVRTNRMGGIERDRQRREQILGSGVQRRGRRGQVILHEIVHRTLVGCERGGHMNVDGPIAVQAMKLGEPFDLARHPVRNRFQRLHHVQRARPWLPQHRPAEKSAW